jgi:nitrogen-specific signal transduction histidine kinase
LALAVLNAIQNPVMIVDASGLIAFANWEAESFFGASATHLARHNASPPSFLWQPASHADRAGARAQVRRSANTASI